MKKVYRKYTLEARKYFKYLRQEGLWDRNPLGLSRGDYETVEAWSNKLEWIRVALGMTRCEENNILDRIAAQLGLSPRE